MSTFLARCYSRLAPRLGTLLRILLMLVSLFVFYRVQNNFDFSLEFGSNPLFTLILVLSILAISSLCFWHCLLWRAVFPNPDTPRPRARILLLRGIDYIWYSSALIAALMAMTDIERTRLETRLALIEGEISRLKQNQASLVADASEGCRILESSTYNPNANDVTDQLKEARFLCDRYIVDEVGLWRDFSDVCKRFGFSRGGDNEGPVLLHGPHPEEIDSAVESISTLCTVYNMWDYSNERHSALEQLLTEIAIMPGPKEVSWIVVLLLVIGLRVTKTSAEIAEVWRISEMRFRPRRERKPGDSRTS